MRGPVFTHILLADEINRAPAKTQSALLEVMQEYQVTLEGQTLPLPKPFMVLATQNPVETEGTYPLPEAQLDRFLFKIEIGYPSLEDEIGVVVRATTDQAGDELPLSRRSPVPRRAPASPGCRRSPPGSASTNRWSTTRCGSRVRRATIRASRWAAVRAARSRWCAAPAPRPCSTAAMFVTPDDVKRIALPALRHRIALTPDALLEGRSANDVLLAAMQTVPAPRV